MKKIFILISVLFLFLSTTAFAVSKNNNDIVLKNKLFKITLPEKFKGSFISEIKKDRIYIYDKQSKEAGFEGFAFGITAYKNPSQYAGAPSGKKLGELVNKKNIYDIVITYPTEVQHDYTKDNNPPKSYKLLYDYGENIIINGIKKSTYYKNRGTKGENLYNEVIDKHIKAIKEKWDSQRLEDENMSYMYNVIAQNIPDVLNSIGYKYYDLNGDGIEELLIGEIAQGEWKDVIYDIYTIVNRKPAHVISGGTRNRFYVCDDSFLCNEYSSGANESGVRVYDLVRNSIELVPQVAFKYDGYKNAQNPYFVTYGSSIENDDEWENVDKKTYEKRFSIFKKYQRFDYTPLSNE